ncbi:hypothetical protein BSNK01_17400 [Bacillaceae bacterium]
MSEQEKKPTPEEKKAAAAKAREEALRKLQERKAAAAKAKADTEAGADAGEKASAAKLAQENAQAAGAENAPEERGKTGEPGGAAPADNGDENEKAKAIALAKAKAAAAAKAKAAAAAKAKAQARAAEGDGGDDEKAKAIAAAKAKAAAAAKAKAAALAKAKAGGGTEGKTAAEAKKPSKNQPLLDKYVQRITEAFGAEVIEDAYINELSKEMPTLVIKNERWHDVARLLKEHEDLAFDYLSNLLGVDYPDRMEVVYYFYSYRHRQPVCVKVKTNREAPAVPSVTDLWQGADWNEREAYDLLGIRFPGHPNLRRILLPDDWVGHPLRKDYEPLDEGV